MRKNIVQTGNTQRRESHRQRRKQKKKKEEKKYKSQRKHSAYPSPSPKPTLVGLFIPFYDRADRLLMSTCSFRGRERERESAYVYMCTTERLGDGLTCDGLTFDPFFLFYSFSLSSKDTRRAAAAAVWYAVEWAPRVDFWKVCWLWADVWLSTFA